MTSVFAIIGFTAAIAPALRCGPYYGVWAPVQHGEGRQVMLGGGLVNPLRHIEPDGRSDNPGCLISRVFVLDGSWILSLWYCNLRALSLSTLMNIWKRSPVVTIEMVLRNPLHQPTMTAISIDESLEEGETPCPPVGGQMARSSLAEPRPRLPMVPHGPQKRRYRHLK